VRIVLLNQYYVPSEAPTGLLLADLGEALVAAGHEVTAICSDRDYADPDSRHPREETRGGVRVRRVPGSGFGRGRRLGRLADYVTFMAGALLKLAVHRKPDVVVVLTTPPMLAFPAWLIARLRSASLVFWVMDVYPELAFELGVLRRGSVGGAVLRYLSRRVLKGADSVVALGEHMAAHLKQAGARSVETVHNWADGRAIRPRSTEEHPLRESWGWTDRFVVLYSGNLGLAHDFETVLDGAEILRERKDVLLAFVGSGPQTARVKSEVRRRGLDNVEFRPWMALEQLGSSLTAGDVHLVTLRSHLAGLLVPSKIYGILAAGRPAIYVGPEESEVAEILRDGECGVSVAPGEARRFADTVLAYADDPSRRAEHGRRARALYERAFDRTRALRRLTDVIGAAGG
jgi:glycosyltransferase involved in cell wall biosynthesis